MLEPRLFNGWEMKLLLAASSHSVLHTVLNVRTVQAAQVFRLRAADVLAFRTVHATCIMSACTEEASISHMCSYWRHKL